MAQASNHGKWTISSSDDDEALPLSGTTTVKAEQPSAPSPTLGPKAEAAPVPSRPAATPSQLNPGKRKKEVCDGSGWALSDSDDEEGKVPEEEPPPNPKAKKAKAESARPPSPHGRLYYVDEPEDFFESSLPCLNDAYRFYLNKVTGVDRRYNRGALHIRGEGVSAADLLHHHPPPD